MNALELWDKHIEDTRQSLLQDGTCVIRQDLFKLSQFVKARRSIEVVTEVNSAELFWEIWRPTAIQVGDTEARSSSDLDENPPPLAPEMENAFLGEIARLESECRIPYAPDTEDWRSGTTMEQFNAGSQYVHVGAASALRHWKRDGFSDYVRQTLREVSRVLYLLGVDDVIGYDVAETRGDFVTLCGVRSLVLSRFFDIKFLDGEYEEAFNIAAMAEMLSEGVSEAIDIDEESLGYIVQEDFRDEDRKIRTAIRSHFKTPILNPQQVVDSFEGLKRISKSEDWRWVTQLCFFLARTSSDELWEAEILNEDGQEEMWSEYWRRSEGWSSAQLSQNNYRELRRQDERDASEKRLVGYFFGETWRNIPEKAQERLVNADHLWFSNARGSAIDAVLNDLQVAAETTCYDFVWEPLRKAKGGQELLEFKKRDNDLNQNHRFPTLFDYAWVCGQRFFKEFLRGLGLDEEDQLFLTSDLESALDFLRRGRDVVQHDPNSRLRREDMERLVKLFLGIGQQGVLCRLAEIGPKLAGK